MIFGKRPIVVCGFPGIGKTEAAKRCEGISDLENIRFPVPDSSNWPYVYISALEDMLKDENNKYILASCQLSVRQELIKKEIPFICVVPQKELKDEYLARYLKRGDDVSFIISMSNYWNKLLDEIESRNTVIHLGPGQYLSDILPSKS